MNPRTLECKQRYEGKEYFCNDSIHTFIVDEFISRKDVVIRFPESGLVLHKSVDQLNNGITYPFIGNCPIYFKNNKLKYEGAYFRTNEGYVVQITEYRGIGDVSIKFQDEFGYETVSTIQNISKGQIKNPYHKNKFGGYLGVGPHRSDKYDWLYRIWYNILIRANDIEYYMKYREYNTVAYYNTIMDPYFLNYSNFAQWYLSETSNLNPNYRYEVDKDLLYRFYANNTNGAKCYGPNCCVLIPHELNVKLQLNNLKSINTKNKLLEKKDVEKAISNASAEIKKCAEMYYRDNAISESVYNIIANS